jgi:predicted outer membrane lipoprotein
VIDIMVSFDQRIVLPAETQSLISTLTFVFFLLAVAFAILSVMIYQLTMAIRAQNEMLGMRNRIQARRMEGKKE